MKTPLAPLAFLTALAVAGCTSPFGADGQATYASMGFDGTTWPDLHGQKVVMLDHGAFGYMFEPARDLFKARANGTLEHIEALDTGDALNRAIREKDAPSFDLVYGLDNAYLPAAVKAGALRPYTPQLGSRIGVDFLFFGAGGEWPATPVDHGFIAVNVDPRANLTVESLYDVRDEARHFVTEDPRTSSPGLGFLLATIATFGEGTPYDWQDYWRDLFANGVTITPDWSTAYASHFTGGYGQYETGFAGTKALVTSYTTSPAYEMFYGATEKNGLVLAPKATFHQIETVAIAAKARHLAAAQAFVEFTLTKEFQDLHAEYNAVYPVLPEAKVEPIFQGNDPAPGTFQDAGLPADAVGPNVERWVNEWTDLYEAHQAA